MVKKVSSKGREKRKTSGGGNVHRRGDGVNTGGPVGSSSGYAKRKQGNTKPSGSSIGGSSGGSSGGGFKPSFSSGNNGAARKPGKLNLKKILLYAVIIIVGYFILKNMFGGSGCAGGGLGGIAEGVLPAISEQTNQSSGSATEQETFTDLPAELNLTVSEDARDKRTTILGDGRDIHTIMIYMCGTDLESRGGMATADLNEILHANISKNVNIIIETGGTKKWQNKIISSKTNQRYQATSEGLVRLDENVGRKEMTDPETLTDFIRYCSDNFEANRYTLILWDHGGGSTQGYGHDELAPGTTMTLDEIDSALRKARVSFDLVGFDACLMATYETAMMLDKYADYFIASEETEPGIGWYYTDWISALSANTSMSTPQIGKNIIDDFVKKCYEANSMDKTTLSIIDLAEFSGIVPKKFKTFAKATAGLIKNEQYKIVSDARNGSREFGPANALDQIDLIHLAQNMNTPESDALIESLRQCIKYNKTSRTISNANGVSIYFPYDKIKKLGTTLTIYDEIGMDEDYTDCLKSFANLEAGGQIVTSGSSSPMGSLLGSLGGASGGGSSGGGIGMQVIGGLLGSFLQGGDFGSILGTQDSNATDWVNPEQIQNSQEYYEQNYLDSAHIVLTEKDGGYVLALSDKEWDTVQNVQLNVFLDDGSGFIDLGMDNAYEFNNDGDLMIDYDNTWIAINGQVISYYFVAEDYQGDRYNITGRVPAMLNGERVDLVLMFTDEKPYGEVVGARRIYVDDPDTVAKGLIDIKDGDKIDFLCDYYTYDEQYNNSYYLGEQMIVQGDLIISNVDVGNDECKVTYMLTDIYNNAYWTPAIIVSD